MTAETGPDRGLAKSYERDRDTASSGPAGQSPPPNSERTPREQPHLRRAHKSVTTRMEAAPGGPRSGSA